MVLPILHLNGYKIANPCVLARISHEELEHLFRGYGYTPYFVEGHEPAAMHELMAATLDKVIGKIERIKADARRNGFTERPRWPMIVLRTPKGWTCPKEIDGKRTEDYWRSHQVPMGQMHENDGARPPSRKVDEELSARGALRQQRSSPVRLGRPCSPRQPPHERQPAHQRWLAASGAAASEFP